MTTASHGWIILGASSPLARAFAFAIAKPQQKIILVGRDTDDLTVIGQDLTLRTHAKTHIMTSDVLHHDQHAALVNQCCRLLGKQPMHIFCAIGMMPSQRALNDDAALLTQTLQTNGASLIALLHCFAAPLEQRGDGSLTVLSSVAGDRGKPSNYVYGAAKASVSVYLEGLRARLHPHGIPVLTVKAGPIDSSMTWNLATATPVAHPADLARAIKKAWRRKKNVLYYPHYWRWIMMVIRHLPEAVLKRIDF